MLPLLLQSAEISPARRSRTAETHINKLRGSEKKDEITLPSLPPLLPRNPEFEADPAARRKFGIEDQI